MKTIGKLAKELDINVETIRFYEKEGLISQPTKPENGYRLYGNAIKNNLKYIAKAKALGFTLKEISSLMSMENNPTIWLSAKFKYPFSYALP
jgi:MerR family mercuric resistance operon transcriptional regulator